MTGQAAAGRFKGSVALLSRHVAARVGIPLALPQVGLALLATEAHRDARNCRERILGSGVNARLA
jgi:hypothetical protein